MAYIKGYTYDIFISYAHMDNEKLTGQAYGWIEQFYKDLNLMLLRRIGQMDSIKIWWDYKKLDGSKLFDQSIEDGIKQSAILICLNTPGYLGSAYCRKELAFFHQKALQENIGLKVGDRSRIINVLLNNIPYTQWPPELSGTTGFPFHDAADKDDLGDPLDIGGPRMRTQLQDLRDAIVSLINDFPKEELSMPLSVEENKESELADNRFTIYIGEVADTLRTIRKRTIIELEKKGYKVTCGVPPPEDAVAHEKLVKEKLAEADLAIHLLDQYPGKEILNSEEMWYPQKQTELGLQYAKSKLVWVPAEIDPASIEEAKYKHFLEELEAGNSAKTYEYIRGIKSTITQEIIDFAEQLKLRKQNLPGREKISVLLDTHYNDQLYALDLGRSLLENDIQPFINPQEDDPRKNINALSDRISQVRSLIFFYGKVSKDWVLERMSAALQLIVTNNFPIEDFYIFLAPPQKDPGEIALKQKFLKVNVIDNSSNQTIDTATLQDLLKNLKD